MAAVTIEAIDEALAQVQAAKVDIPDIPVETGQVVPKVEPPKVVDPLGTDGQVVKTGDILTADQVLLLAPRDRYGEDRRSGCAQRCAGAPKIGGYGYCQRRGAHGPELPHLVLVPGTNEVAWAWQNGEVPLDPTPDVLADADDLKVELFTQGLRVNYRNKRDILFVLAAPRRKDESVEVVDLTHQRMRKIKKELLIPERADDPVPSQDEMRWMGEFIAARRQSAIDIALREMENRRWNRAQMNTSLAKIDIAPRPVRYGASIALTMDLVLPAGVKTIDGVNANAKLLEVLQAGLTQVAPGVTVRRVHDVYGGDVNEIRG